jgi:hypothetical protein
MTYSMKPWACEASRKQKRRAIAQRGLIVRQGGRTPRARGSHVPTESIGEQIESNGLSSTAWRILAALSEPDGLLMAELARRLVCQASDSEQVDRPHGGGAARTTADAE